MVGRSILNVKVRREIKANWKQYLSVIIIAMLAVTLFTGIWANYKNFQEKLSKIYDESKMCDGIIMTTSYNENIETFLKEEKINYQKRLYYPSKVGDNAIYLITYNDNDQMNFPYQKTASEKEKVFVDENFLTRCLLEIGSTFTVPFDFQVMGNMIHMNVELEISGTMVHPESLENTSYNPSLVYVNDSYLKEQLWNALSDDYKKFGDLAKQIINDKFEASFNQFLIKDDHPTQLISKIDEKFSNDSNFLYALETKDLPSNMTIEADVIQAKQLLYIFPIIFYVVALLIILTSISQLINREQKNIGLLKALGFTKWEVLRHYTDIYIVLGCIGSIFGMILGPFIIPKVMDMKYNILYQLPKMPGKVFRFEFLISVVILLVIIILTSLFACFDATSKVPAESLRGENSVKMKLSFLSKIKAFRKIPLACLMAFRNMKRKISRTVMVIIGVLGCSSLLVCGFGIENTIYYGLDLELEEYIPYDISVSYQINDTEQENLMETFHNKLFSIDQIKTADVYAKYNANIMKNDKIVASYVYALPNEAKVFKVAYDQNSCLISSKVAEEINCKAGDQITFNYQNQKYEVTVTSVVDFCITQGIFLPSNYFEEKGISLVPSGAWIQTSHGENNETIVNQLSNMDEIITAYSMETMRIKADNTIGSIKIMTLTIKIFAILLAIVVLYNLALLNFKERIKDIATLKVLGFSKFEIGSSFIIEILFLTFIGSIVGLFFGKPLLIAVLSINENPLLSYIYHINFASYIYTILLTCGTSLFINIIFAFLTNKVKMVESLKSVE